jgi:hypothetical protein
MCDQLMDERVQETLDRVTRLESRLVQLMLFLGADPHGKNDTEGFLDLMEDLLNEHAIPKTTDFAEASALRNSGAGSVGIDWTAFERPACQRRR